MRKLSVYLQLSIDGYCTSPTGDPSWMHRPDDDPELAAFVASNASGDGELLFGRATYELMKAFWATPAAAQAMPAVAKGMNAKQKYVASRTLERADWQPARVLAGDAVAGVRELKATSGPPIVTLGSGSLVAQLVEAGLVDEYQLLFLPIVLGAGRTAFTGQPRWLKHRSTRTFRNGNVFVVYDR
ncbi:MAG: dihydrofolate reductase family protein [Acidobacteriota bacterium]